MLNPVAIENIEEMRRLAGIDDCELREEIRALKMGDVVRLTLLAGAAAFETVSVRITSIRGSVFRGKLVARPALTGLRSLGAGAPVLFSPAHIHSLHRNP